MAIRIITLNLLDFLFCSHMVFGSLLSSVVQTTAVCGSYNILAEKRP
jgi:hypothetical protein